MRKYDLRKGDLFVLSSARDFGITSCGYIHRDHRYMYMVHVCFYV